MISIASWVFGILVTQFLFYFFVIKPIKQGRLVKEMKTLKIKSLDVYKNEQPYELESVIESTNL